MIREETISSSPKPGFFSLLGGQYSFMSRYSPLTQFSDTTAIALTEIFIILTIFPQYVALIREELDPVIAASSFSSQKSYPILDSIINEAFRLYPPTLFGSPRVTPSEGLQIGDVYVPSETVVYMQTYQLHRDSRNFVQPNEFVPERWTTRTELILNRSAYIPFSMGEWLSYSMSSPIQALRKLVTNIGVNRLEQLPRKISCPHGTPLCHCKDGERIQLIIS